MFAPISYTSATHLNKKPWEERWKSKLTGLEHQNKCSEPTSQDVCFAQWLAQEKNVLGVPVSVYFSPAHQALGQDYIRFNFFKKEETLRQAEQNLIANA
jgi:aspartate/methionine/tyrosine aminotransferase